MTSKYRLKKIMDRMLSKWYIPINEYNRKRYEEYSERYYKGKHYEIRRKMYMLEDENKVQKELIKSLSDVITSMKEAKWNKKKY